MFREFPGMQELQDARLRRRTAAGTGGTSPALEQCAKHGSMVSELAPGWLTLPTVSGLLADLDRAGPRDAVRRPGGTGGGRSSEIIPAQRALVHEMADGRPDRWPGAGQDGTQRAGRLPYAWNCSRTETAAAKDQPP